MFLRRETPSQSRVPAVKKRNLKSISDLKGVLFSQSNYRIKNDPAMSKTVFIGHGSGDKKYGTKAALENYQYLFISGPKHMAILKDVGADLPESSLIKIGNLRFDDYLNGKLNREVLMDRIGISAADRNRKTVLYAPTWKWGNGTLEKYAKLFCREITREHNLIIRPHHFDSHLIPKLKLWVKMAGIKHVYFSNTNRIVSNDTMHDFCISDILISDTSSVLYEYLVTGKPVIVANTDFNDLHNMPDKMNIMSIADRFNGTSSILDVINRNLGDEENSAKYTEMLHNCFYFNDGKSIDRAVDFVNRLKVELKQ